MLQHACRVGLRAAFTCAPAARNDVSQNVMPSSGKLNTLVATVYIAQKTLTRSPRTPIETEPRFSFEFLNQIRRSQDHTIRGIHRLLVQPPRIQRIWGSGSV